MVQTAQLLPILSQSNTFNILGEKKNQADPISLKPRTGRGKNEKKEKQGTGTRWRLYASKVLDLLAFSKRLREKRKGGFSVSHHVPHSTPKKTGRRVGEKSLASMSSK